MFTAYQLPKGLRVKDGHLAPISRAVGRPMRIFRLRNSMTIGKDSFYLQNRPATSVTRTVDLASTLFGMAPIEWQDYGGSVLVAYSDKQPLKAHGVVAMANFCANHMGQHFRDSFESTITNEQAMAGMTPAAYYKY